MKFIKPTFFVGAVAAAFISLPVGAANPHFINTAFQVNNSGEGVCSWKEAGLGNNHNVTYICSATAEVQYACINRGKKNPSATNKRAVSDDVEAEGTFSSGKNGQITAALTFYPPAAPDDWSCPPGQTEAVLCGRYSDIVLSDDTNGITVDLGDATFLSPTHGEFCDLFWP
jgi:hypothetical protein